MIRIDKTAYATNGQVKTVKFLGIKLYKYVYTEEKHLSINEEPRP